MIGTPMNWGDPSSIPWSPSLWATPSPTIFVPARETNRIIGQISDPLGRGWDLFGTIDWVDNLIVVSPA